LGDRILAATPVNVLIGFRQRWQVEVTFEEVRAHLGVETQRQWSDKSDFAHDSCSIRIILAGYTFGQRAANTAAVLVTPNGLVS
jgi:hypothetical protein